VHLVGYFHSGITMHGFMDVKTCSHTFDPVPNISCSWFESIAVCPWEQLHCYGLFCINTALKIITVAVFEDGQNRKSGDISLLEKIFCAVCLWMFGKQLH